MFFTKNYTARNLLFYQSNKSRFCAMPSNNSLFVMFYTGFRRPWNRGRHFGDEQLINEHRTIKLVRQRDRSLEGWLLQKRSIEQKIRIFANFVLKEDLRWPISGQDVFRMFCPQPQIWPEMTHIWAPGCFQDVLSPNPNLSSPSLFLCKNFPHKVTVLGHHQLQGYQQRIVNFFAANAPQPRIIMFHNNTEFL